MGALYTAASAAAAEAQTSTRSCWDESRKRRPIQEPMALANKAIAPSRPSDPPLEIVTIAAQSRGTVSRREMYPPLSDTPCMMVVTPPPRVWTRKNQPIIPTSSPPTKGMRSRKYHGLSHAAVNRF